MCEMYKDGKVKFEQYDNTRKQMMALTPEECELIRNKRKEEQR